MSSSRRAVARGNVDDLVPGLNGRTACPWRRDDRRLASRVADGLSFVLLTVELEEHTELGSGEVNAGDEGAAAVVDHDLT